MPSNRIAALRKAAGLSQAGLAARVSPPVDKRTISRWENQEVAIPDERKLELAGLFGVPAAHLLGWDDGEVAA
jgi:transcriptional regulator with XRE-family HTH domain